MTKKKKISGIYEIVNQVNGKIYIGSSIDIERRRNDHFNTLRNNRHKNKHLQSSYNKHGEEAFIHSVIQDGIPREKLIEFEQYYMDLCDCYNPKIGYNLSPTAGNSLGVKHTDETKKKISIKHSKGPYTFVNPAGIEVTRASYIEFQKEFGLNNAQLLRVTQGKNNHCKGWRVSSKETLGIVFLPARRPRTLINPKGEAITRDSFASFEREFGLRHSALSRVCRGLEKHHHGWTLPKDNNVG